MIVPQIIFASNVFVDSYSNADFLGKLIFLALLLLSIISWVIIIHKSRIVKSIKKSSACFEESFSKQNQQPLKVQYTYTPHLDTPHPFYDLYQILRKNTLEILAKNRHFSQMKGNNETTPFLSHADMELVESHLATAISSHNKTLEKHLYLLSTVVTLAPFLGLLGTVWGILTSFSEMQAGASGNTSQMVLHGLSLALATTVLGLINAIPALIGYNYLKNTFREYQQEMERFANKIVSTVELHYRQVDTVQQ